MTEAEKLLQETKSAVVAETQTEDICVIDSDMRIIDIPEQFKVLGVESDKDVRAMQFRIPKTYKGTDLSAFTISVNYQNARGMKGRYIVTDKKVSGDQIEFSWTVGKTATVYRGDTRFIVCMRLIGSDGVIKKEFNTTLATMTVLEGLEVDDPVIEQEEKDIIAQLLQIVDDKSKEAVQAVTEEGTKQIKAVQAAAQEIAADREQIKTNKADIADLMQTKAGAIINSARGERIAVGDSAGAFFEGLKLYGRSEQVTTKGYQLFDASKIPTKSIGGATITNNGDGSFTISGSGNLTTNVYHYHTYNREELIQFLKAGNIYLKQNDDTNPKALLLLYRTTDSKTVLQLDNETTVGTITDEMLNYDDLAFRIYIHAQSGQLIKPGTVKPMLYQSGDGTWEPFTGGKPSPSMEYKQDPESSGDSGEIGINIHGYNLFDASKILTNSEKDVANNGDGSFTISGGKTLRAGGVTFTIPKNLFKPGIYTFLLNGTKMQPNPYFNVIFENSKGNLYTFSADNSRFELKQEHIDSEGFTARFGYYTDGGTSIGGTWKPMFYIDGDGTWEPFQLLRSTQFSTPNGLLGLPVDSDGNYTDSNGQQWICDEMDFKRGKYIQRVRKVTFNGSEAWTLETNQGATAKLFNTRVNDASKVVGIKLLCDGFLGTAAYQTYLKNMECTVYQDNSGKYPNENWLYFRDDSCNAVSDFKAKISNSNITAIYPLKTPIETDIPEETMNAYRKLYTNYPSTVIQNDSGAGMEVEYVADTKQFILDQIKALVQA